MSPSKTDDSDSLPVPGTMPVAEAVPGRALATETAGSRLVVKHLSVDLGATRALDSVSLSARAGELTALVGPNGAGKTTLLRTLAGLLPYRGSVELVSDAGSIDLSRLPSTERATKLAYVPQKTELVSALTVGEVVGFGRYGALRQRSRDADPEAVGRALAATDLDSRRESSFTELSGGEQRRVLIARALATGARVLLLDEPTASLDLAHAASLFTLLRELARQGHLILLALHHLTDVLEYAESTVVLDRGRIAATGPTANALDARILRRIFGLECLPGQAPAFRRAANGLTS